MTLIRQPFHPAQDWLFVQFYNQNANCYTNYEGLFLNSSSARCWAAKTSVKEISAAGVPLPVIIAGKPLVPEDAGNGWISASNFHDWVEKAGTDLGWMGGVFAWQYSYRVGTAWLGAIYPCAHLGGTQATAVAPAVGSVVCESQTQTASSTGTRTPTSSQTRTPSQSPSYSRSSSTSSSRTATWSRLASKSKTMSKTKTASLTATATTTATQTPTPSQTPSFSTSATGTSTAFPVTKNGRCGQGVRGNPRCQPGLCCSQYGYCGVSRGMR